MNQPRLACYGNLTIDDVVLPDGSKRPGCVGGDALYATLAARPFEPRTQPVALLGNDVDEKLVSTMRDAGLSLDGMARRDVPTLHNQVVYAADGSRQWTLYNDESDFPALSPFADDIPETYREAPRHLISAMALEATQSIAEFLAASENVLVGFDPQEDYIVGNQALIKDIISSVDIVLPSEDEVERLLAHKNWSKAARELAGLGPSLVVIKRGPNGALLYDRNADLEYHVPVHPRSLANPETVIDTTGAGDSFCGAFMAAVKEWGAPTSLLAGGAAASVTVSDYGANALLTTPSGDIKQRFNHWRASGQWAGSGTENDPFVWIVE
jgi:ribokinase